MDEKVVLPSDGFGDVVIATKNGNGKKDTIKVDGKTFTKNLIRFQNDTFSFMQKIHLGNLVQIGFMIVFAIIMIMFLAGVNQLVNQLKVQNRYNYLGKCEITKYTNAYAETDSTPNITSTDHVVRNGIIAISPDWMKRREVFYDDRIDVKELEETYVVDDCMAERWSKKLDIFTFSKYDAEHFNGTFTCHLIKSDRRYRKAIIGGNLVRQYVDFNGNDIPGKYEVFYSTESKRGK